MIRAAVFGILLAGAVAPGAVGQRPAPAPTWPANVPPGEWHLPGRDYASTRHSPLTQITPANVLGLHASWTFSTGLIGAHEGNPLVVGSVMYLHAPFPNAVFALDLAKPGAPLVWRYAIPAVLARSAPPTGCCDAGSRGLAYHPSGKIYVPLLHGELAALDAGTGREIWRLKNADGRLGATMSAAPLVVKDLVIVGTSGSEFGVRGTLTAYHAVTGQLIWRAYHTGPDTDVLIDGDPNIQYPSHRGRDLGVSSWPGDEWKRGGATASGWISYDPELDLIFYGTDHPGAYNASVRAGDNKWSSTIFAREAATGKVKWAYQVTPHDQWGYDASNENILADLTMAGKPVKALVHFDKNGFAYTLDRTIGRVLLAERFGPANWTSRIDLGSGQPVVDPRFAQRVGTTTGICPAASGAKGLNPGSFSPVAALFFVPISNLCMDLTPTPVAFVPGKAYQGATIKMTSATGPNRGRVIAWDARTGSVTWQAQEAYPVTGGVLSTGGGLVFYGTMDGWLKAVDAKSGVEVWRFKTPSGIVGSPISFAGPDGKQYVAVLAGLGGWIGLGANGAFPKVSQISNPGGTLIVFAL